MNKRKRVILFSALIGILLVSALSFTLVAHANYTQIQVGSDPYGIAFAPSNGDIYVANGVSNYISVIDTSTNAIVKNIGLPSNSAPGGVAFASSNGDIYVVDTSGAVSVIDTSTNQPASPTSSIPVGGYPVGIAFAPTNGDIYVVQTAGYVQVIDTFTNVLLPVTIQLPMGSYPLGGIVYAPSNGDIYVADSAIGAVSAIDTVYNMLIPPTIGLGETNPANIAYASNGDIYVSDFNPDDAVSVIDTSTNQLVSSPFPIGLPAGEPSGIAFAPSNGDMYVTDSSGAVSVIDTSTNRVLPPSISIPTSTNQYGVASRDSATFASSNGDIYVANSLANTVSVIPTLNTNGDLSASISSLQASISALTSDVTRGFSSVLSAIANIGVTGPTVGTSNNATVASASIYPQTRFTSSPSNWILISPATQAENVTARVIAGFTVSLNTTSTSALQNAILYISTTNSPASSSATYAIPLGTITSDAKNNDIGISTGQLRFPYSIPSNSNVYVQVVFSTSGQTLPPLTFYNLRATVQLQLLTTPING